MLWRQGAAVKPGYGSRTSRSVRAVARRSGPRRPEPARAVRRPLDDPLCVLELLGAHDEQLRDAVAVEDAQRLGPGVPDEDAPLVGVVLVDQPGRVGEDELRAVARAAARQHESDVALGEPRLQSGGDDGA